VPAGKELNINEGNFIFVELSDSYIVNEPLTLLVITILSKGIRRVSNLLPTNSVIFYHYIEKESPPKYPVSSYYWLDSF